MNKNRLTGSLSWDKMGLCLRKKSVQFYGKQIGTLAGHHNQPAGPATGRTKMKTFIFNNKKYKFKDMEEANEKLPIELGAWFGPEEGEPENTYRWVEGNFWD